MSSVKILACASCGESEVFESKKVVDNSGPNLRESIKEWRKTAKSNIHFDVSRSEYERRVEISASTLDDETHSSPNSTHVCWFCLSNGDLNDALDNITAQKIREVNSFRSLLKQSTISSSDDLSPPDYSYREILELEELILAELEIEKQLNMEMKQVEQQLQNAAQQQISAIQDTSSLDAYLELVSESNQSLKTSIHQFEQDLKLLPANETRLWLEFFQIEDQQTFVTVCGIPLAFEPFENTTDPASKNLAVNGSMSTQQNSLSNTKSPPNDPTKKGKVFLADSRDAHNIKAGMFMIAALVSRLYYLCPKSDPSYNTFIAQREFRIWANPPQIQHRASEETISMLPFNLEPNSGQKEPELNPRFGEALGKLLIAVRTLFRFWDTYPKFTIRGKLDPHDPNPQLCQETLVLDVNNPSRWNQAMRLLCLNLNNLIAISFKKRALLYEM